MDSRKKIPSFTFQGKDSSTISREEAKELIQEGMNE